MTGAILGEQIVIYGLDGGAIVYDARGIRNGDYVTVNETI